MELTNWMCFCIVPLVLIFQDLLEGVSGGICYKKYVARKGKCRKPLPIPSNQIGGYSYHKCCRLPDAAGWKEKKGGSRCIRCVKIVDGNWGSWTEWSPCSVTCDWGKTSRSRKCNNPEPLHGGKECAGAPKQAKQCYGGIRCPINGKWSNWGDWSPCSRTCEKGIHFRYRACNSPAPQYGGTDCLGPSEESQNCVEAKHCPINGNWGHWGPWSSCSKTCEIGRMTRKRNCDNPKPQYGGNSCAGKTNETNPCQVEERCIPVTPPRCKKGKKSSSSGSGEGSGDGSGLAPDVDQECDNESESGSGSGSGDGETLLVITPSNTSKTGVKILTTVKPTVLSKTNKPVTPKNKSESGLKEGSGSESGSGSGSDPGLEIDVEKGDVDEVTPKPSTRLTTKKIKDNRLTTAKPTLSVTTAKSPNPKKESESGSGSKSVGSGSGSGFGEDDDGEDDTEPVLVEKGDQSSNKKKTIKKGQSSNSGSGDKDSKNDDEFVVIKS